MDLVKGRIHRRYWLDRKSYGARPRPSLAAATYGGDCEQIEKGFSSVHTSTTVQSVTDWLPS